MWIIDLVLKPLIILIISEVSWQLYIKIKNRIIKSKYIHINQSLYWEDFIQLKNPSIKSHLLNSEIANVIPVIIFIVSLFGVVLFPLESDSFFFLYEYGIFLILSSLLIIPISGIILAISSQHFSRIQTTKEFSSKIIQYYLPLILCIISNYMIIYYRNPHPNNTIFNMGTIIEFQNTNTFMLWGKNYPAIFLLINPLSFLGYISAVIGLYRDTNLDAHSKESLRVWEIFDEFTGKSKALINLGKALNFFSIICLIIPCYLGFLWIGEDIMINIGILLISLLFFILFFGSIAQGKPRTVFDRKIKDFIRTPLFFSILACLYAYLIQYFNFLI